MSVYSNVSVTASLISHPTRMAMLIALSDGRVLSAGDLASTAGVSPQTASGHLSKLMQGSLITVEKSGKHRYYKLSGPNVAEAVEAIAVISPPPQVKSLRESNDKKALYSGRTCYGHLAGNLGVKLTEALIKLDYVKVLEKRYQLTKSGNEWIRDFKVVLSRKVDYEAIPYHIDWTARKHHIAGPLALAITKRLLDLGWIEEGSTHRSIQVTEMGRSEILKEFGFDPISVSKG
ncbi:transcriptional regulator [Virgibacillus phasianinus]|uniref:Transcriptional regulator n=1 Tax=Virgibacillus phasianinus TaxID=2017483 RepID=A0A220U8G8_9BACI|nr:winged helix-turn-helix domain-containing protein [Virgibacillus phasianinus]ASK64186.1 transcriptional regulator [Virgibacillus phasianinus]